MSLLTWILVVFLATSSPTLKVSSPSAGATVGKDFILSGTASGSQIIEVVAEFPRSQLPQYRDYEDVIERWATRPQLDGSFQLPIRLQQLPSPSPIVLRVRQPGAADVELKLIHES